MKTVRYYGSETLNKWRHRQDEIIAAVTSLNDSEMFSSRRFHETRSNRKREKNVIVFFIRTRSIFIYVQSILIYRIKQNPETVNG